MPNKFKLTNDDYKSIRERWDKEDGLLNTRTGIFLTSNTILFAAGRIQAINDLYFQLCITFVGIILSIMWILVSLRTAKFLNYFGYLSGLIIPDNHYMKFIFTYKKVEKEKKQGSKPNKGKKKDNNFLKYLLLDLIKFYPTKIISLYMPLFIICCWLSFALYILVVNNKVLYNHIILLLFLLTIFFIIILVNIIYAFRKYKLKKRINKYFVKS